MLCYCSLLAILIVSVASQQCPNQAATEQLLADAHIPGAVIVVVNRTHIVHEQTFGYESLSPLKSMDADRSIFALASVSKTFIAVAVMQLVELNSLDLDADVNEYLASGERRVYHPLYPRHPITLRQLLSHSASINRNDQMEGAFVQLEDAALTSTSLADTCYTYLNPNSSNWLPHEPGTVTLYSNIGSALAALVVERVARMPYDRYVKEKILKPLDIDTTRAAFRLADLATREDLVRHYTFNASRLGWLNGIFPQLNLIQVDCSDWISIPFYGPSFYPANLLRISARSLSKFVRMFINNGSSLLSPRSIATMRTVVSGVVPYESIHLNGSAATVAQTEYGLIWNWRNMDGRRYIGHTGNMPGVANGILINEKSTIAVIVLTNGDATLNNAFSKHMADALTCIQLQLIHAYEIA